MVEFVSVCLQHNREQQYRNNAALRHVWVGIIATCRQGISYTLYSEENNHWNNHWTGDMLEERQHAYKSMREVQGGKVRPNAQMNKALTQNIQAGYLVWYFDP